MIYVPPRRKGLNLQTYITAVFLLWRPTENTGETAVTNTAATSVKCSSHRSKMPFSLCFTVWLNKNLLNNNIYFTNEGIMFYNLDQQFSQETNIWFITWKSFIVRVLQIWMCLFTVDHAIRQIGQKKRRFFGYCFMFLIFFPLRRFDMPTILDVEWNSFQRYLNIICVINCSSLHC